MSFIIGLKVRIFGLVNGQNAASDGISFTHLYTGSKYIFLREYPGLRKLIHDTVADHPLM
jgi:hypothetical protein